MTELDDDSQSLFDAARTVYEPTLADRERVLRGVLLRAGVVVGVTTAASASAASASMAGTPLAPAIATSTGLLSKIGVWMAIGGALGLSGYALGGVVTGDRNPAPAHAVVHSAVVHSAAVPTALATPPPRPAAHELEPAESAAAARSVAEPGQANRGGSPRAENEPRPRLSSSAARVSETGPGASSTSGRAVAAFASERLPAVSSAGTNGAPPALSDEARGLAEVQSALKDGQAAAALRMVEAQRQAFAHGELRQERDAVRILALCAVGRVADARAAARLFLVSAPRSPFAPRIHASCAGQD